MRFRRGFTLIELLVVLAIIALLISLLLPALGAAKDLALRVKCAANERQLGIAFATYTAEHQGLLPYAVSARPGGRNIAFDDALDPYLSDLRSEAQMNAGVVPAELAEQALICPADASPKTADARRSYAMVEGARPSGNPKGLPTGTGVRYITIGFDVRQPRQLSAETGDVLAPAGTLLLTEWVGRSNVGGFDPNLQGDVSTMMFDAPVPLAKASEQLPGTVVSGIYRTMPPHREGSDVIYNYLALDGHVWAARPRDVIGAAPVNGSAEEMGGPWTRAVDD